nr:retrovirus-related Pol polyprotein from transposon TNT 1-94 [Tanacetum cinerariifolium]
MSPSKKLCDDIEDINKVILDLENIDIEIEVEDQAIILLTSLTSSYENVVETLLYWKESLAMEDVLMTLNLKELKKRTDSTYYREAFVVVWNDEMTELVMGS